MSDHAEWQRGDYVVSTDPARVDVDVVWSYLKRSYWAEGIPRDVVERAIANSLNFGVYRGTAQIGFARVITDYATFAYVADVFVLEEFRGQKLAVWLMECVAAHPRLQGLRNTMLGTRDAHSLYEKTGFAPLAIPDRWMQKLDADIYRRAPND
jgi:GNAT superfamily N-acetyltransferase